ncbi:N(5)-(carboxyethyl)ornithine synthase [Acinetobacter radioresistens]|uniref:N(5)-(carboxyethyl)ornithine synthase n=1 Tax=Acinetobacter radioresistens TaxID=40216 RepID=UPI000EC46180|nr:N(5)-(carboxyethyl)ornithine synthase [Acinetobacter radioresistens]MCX0333763.1 N(5)-(carboxyethyl)ornithine synthase [Acinetobacter radioresistens]HAD68483.1 N(5)-(carboxyethyl)ornithine synthase [Acinetobacter radioresistens]
MKTVGLPISDKLNENRRALVPLHIKYIKNPRNLYIEKGYGKVLGYSDKEYLACGVNIVDREIVLKQNIICDPKIGDASYLDQLDNQTIFGWVHAVQNKDITDKLISKKITAIAWEDMFEKGRHVFWRNNEIAGEAAIVHAYTLHGLFPYNTKVALLGRGNIARGALKILTMMGAEVTVYDRRTEQLLREEIGKYDVFVNGILWDTSRKDHIIYKDDLTKMKKGSLIIDISCDRNGGIETSIPTTLTNPTYIVDGIVHYAVDHTPTLFFKTISESLSENIALYLNQLIDDTPNIVLKDAIAVQDGMIIDQRINQFQGR